MKIFTNIFEMLDDISAHSSKISCRITYKKDDNHIIFTAYPWYSNSNIETWQISYKNFNNSFSINKSNSWRDNLVRFAIQSREGMDLLCKAFPIC